MHRRTFLRRSLLTAAGFSVAFSPFDTLLAAPGSPRLSVVQGADFGAACRTAVELVGGMGRYIRPGERVVVKPNIGWDRKPEQGANTHPAVVRALVEMALESGASMVSVFDHTCNEPRRCYHSSGIQDALEPLGGKVRLEHIDRRKFKEIDIPDGVALKKWDLYRDALEADCYINVPVAKHHGLGGLTLGLKNSMGVIGGNRGRLHHNLGQKLADLATIIQPRLTVIDATRMLLRNGPQGGRLEDVRKADTVIASPDPVAADAFATTLFGLAPETLESTVAAHRLGLGEIDLAQVSTVSKRL